MYDIVLYGCTGFTGKLAVSYLTATYGDTIKWAVAGRSKERVQKVADILGEGIPDIIIADSGNEKEILKMVKQTKVMATAAGPFARYGSLLVKVCAETGTDYADITGETNWVREMIALYDDVARKSGARVVSFCGHDSIPWDLSTYMLANKLHEKGEDMEKIDFYDDIESAPSGGTLETAFAIMFGKEKAYRFTAQKELGYDALLKLPSGSKSEHNLKAKNIGYTVAPPKHRSLPYRSFFFMAPVNANSVKRSNALNGYGAKVTYVEGASFGSFFAALFYVLSWAVYGIGVYIAPIRAVMRAVWLPKPGEGPSEEAMDNGHLYVLGVARGTKGTVVKSTMSFEVDPGYKDTARMLVESALALSLDGAKIKGEGGVLTPGSCQKEVLLERLLKTGTAFEFHEK